MIIKIALAAGAAASALALQSVTETAQEVPIQLSRGDGQNHWQAGPWAGTFGLRGSSFRVMNIRSVDRARANFTVNGPGFEGEVSASCEGGQGHFTFAWITWDRDRLSYACDYFLDGEPLDARMELAIQRSGLMGIGRNERAGELHWNDEVYQLETQRLSGVGFPSGRVPGYVIRHRGRDIAGMDYGVMRSTLYLPHEGEEGREAALIAGLSLAFFTDPANMPD